MKEAIKQTKKLLDARCKEQGITYVVELEKQVKNDKELSKNKEILSLIENKKIELEKLK